VTTRVYIDMVVGEWRTDFLFTMSETGEFRPESILAVGELRPECILAVSKLRPECILAVSKLQLE